MLCAGRCVLMLVLMHALLLVLFLALSCDTRR